MNILKRTISKVVKDDFKSYPKMKQTLKHIKKLKAKHAVKTLAIIAVVGTSACTSTTSMFGESDLQLVATEQGIQSFFDGVSGNAMVAKNIDNIPQTTPYHELRKSQNQSRTLRSIGWRPNVVNKKEVSK